MASQAAPVDVGGLVLGGAFDGVGLRVAFVACNKNAARYAEDPAFIYRCENLAHALKTKGAQVWLGHLKHFAWWRGFDVVVFHRPRASWRLRLLLNWLQRRGTRVVADFDDLVFEPDMAHFSPGVLNKRLGLGPTRQQFASHAAALRWFGWATVSTHALQDEVKKVLGEGARVLWVPNTIHWSWRDKPLPARQTHGALGCVAYMPGTRSHDRDFALIEPGLRRLLAQNAHLRLCVTGPIELGLNALSPQMVHQPKLPFAQFDQAFVGVGLNLAPLEPTPFNACKSGIKVMEAAWWGIPTVFCHLPDARRFLQAGGVEATSAQAFEHHVMQWLDDSPMWAEKAHELRAAVLPLADVYKVANTWLQEVAA